MEKHATVDGYISAYPALAQERMSRIRIMIKELAPDVHESISYGMPGYKTFGKPLIYYAAYDKHIGLYATPSGHAAFAKELSVYKQGKGSVQFPLSEELPLELIRKIISFRVDENKQKYGKK